MWLQTPKLPEEQEQEFAEIYLERESMLGVRSPIRPCPTNCPALTLIGLLQGVPPHALFYPGKAFPRLKLGRSFLYVSWALAACEAMTLVSLISHGAEFPYLAKL